MEDQSSLSQVANNRRSTTPTIPPWEIRAVSQVPYLGRSQTPPVTNTEPYQYQTPRVSRSGSDTRSKPTLSTANSAPSRSEYSSPVSQDAGAVHWMKRRHTAAFPSAQLPSAPAPYETPLDLPAGARKTLHRPIMTASNTLPSPPESPCSCHKSDTSASRDVVSQALPGTMSSRASKVRERKGPESGSTHDHASNTQSQSEHKPMSKRLTSAFRGMFKRDPVDESGYEHISDRHWTEET